MTVGERDEELAREASRKAERLARAREGPSAVWSAIMRAVGLGWVLVLPLVLGTVGGGVLARWLGRSWIVFAGLALGLMAGVYGVYRQVKLVLEEDAIDGRGP